MGRARISIFLALLVLISLLLYFYNIKLSVLRKYKQHKTQALGSGITQPKFEDILTNLSVCLKVVEGNETVIKNLKRLSVNVNDESMQERINHGCRKVIDYYSFNTNLNATTVEERDYPVAYSILAHHNIEQLIVLLAQIYSPQNVYCVHIDKKSSTSLTEAFKSVQKCFPNVFLVSEQVDVWYASFSRLQADFNCMRDLLKSPITWKHLINLSGQVRSFCSSPFYAK